MVSLEGRTAHFSVGFQDSKADQQTIDVESAGDGRFSYLAEIGVKAQLLGGLEGAYKVTIGRVEANGEAGARALPSGYGVNVSAQQSLTDRVQAFGLYRRSWRRFASNTEESAALGLALKAPLGWNDDVLSVAAFYAKPHDRRSGALRRELGLEAFWRLQATWRLDVTPVVQLYLRNGRTDQSSPVLTFALRLRYIL